MNRLARALSTNRAGRAKAVARGNVYDETAKNYRHIWKSEILVPYLNNPSKENMFGSNKTKDQHGTMKLQNEEVILRNT